MINKKSHCIGCNLFVTWVGQQSTPLWPFKVKSFQSQRSLVALCDTAAVDLLRSSYRCCLGIVSPVCHRSSMIDISIRPVAGLLFWVLRSINKKTCWKFLITCICNKYCRTGNRYGRPLCCACAHVPHNARRFRHSLRSFSITGTCVVFNKFVWKLIWEKCTCIKNKQKNVH